MPNQRPWQPQGTPPDFPHRQGQWRGGLGAGREGWGPSAAVTAQTNTVGPTCFYCGDPGHFKDSCLGNLMQLCSRAEAKTKEDEAVDGQDLVR